MLDTLDALTAEDFRKLRHVTIELFSEGELEPEVYDHWEANGNRLSRAVRDVDYFPETDKRFCAEPFGEPVRNPVHAAERLRAVRG